MTYSANIRNPTHSVCNEVNFLSPRFGLLTKPRLRTPTFTYISFKMHIYQQENSAESRARRIAAALFNFQHYLP